MKQALICIALCVSVACATTTPIRFDPPQRPSSLRPGMTVVAELNTGQRVTVYVGSIDTNSVVDARTGRRYRFADMRRLKHQRVAVGRTIGLTAGIIGGALLMLIGIAWRAESPARVTELLMKPPLVRGTRF